MSKYTKELLKEHVDSSFTFSEVLRKIKGIEIVHGGMIDHIKKLIIKYEIDFSHFKGKGWSSGKTNESHALKMGDLEKYYLLEKPLKKTNSHNLKLYLYRFNLKNEECEICNINEWCGKRISLQLDHVNGNNLDNRIENLRILCPNCHSQTSTYAGNKNKKL